MFRRYKPAISAVAVMFTTSVFYVSIFLSRFCNCVFSFRFLLVVFRRQVNGCLQPEKRDTQKLFKIEYSDTMNHPTFESRPVLTQHDSRVVLNCLWLCFKEHQCLVDVWVSAGFFFPQTFINQKGNLLIVQMRFLQRGLDFTCQEIIFRL